MREKHAPFPLAWLSTLCTLTCLLQCTSVKYHQVNLVLPPMDINVVYCTQCETMEKFATVFYHIQNPYLCATKGVILGTGFTTVEIKHIFGGT